MDIQRFKAVLNTFADPGTSVSTEKSGGMLVQINDQTILVNARQEGGALWVIDEMGEKMPAHNWLIGGVAKLPLLADRILQFIPETQHFVHPQGNLYDALVDAAPEQDSHVDNALDAAVSLLGRGVPFTTSVLYLTSDAGEGKTTMVHELARQQAKQYKNGTTQWLLVPIELGGRPFIRFDDVIAGYLSNKLRFSRIYYDAFIELVKLGVIIPAFDGFEETLVVNSSGDAYSAIGSLMAALEGQGSVMISARKAFFEYQELRLQARLYDSIGNNSVAFSRLQLCRWGKNEFVRYARLRGHNSPEQLFDSVATALHNPQHALLTRAVLANRLLNVALAEDGIQPLLAKLGDSPSDYFPLFVDALIQREVTKWITSGGEAAQPLLTLEEHRDLLSRIAFEMWLHSSEVLKPDVLQLIGGLFCEERRKGIAVSHQVQQRISQHALLVPVGTTRNAFGFDHEEFRHYFLAARLASLLREKNAPQDSDLLAALRNGSLPFVVHDFVRACMRPFPAPRISEIVAMLKQLAALDSTNSYLHENSGQLLLRLLSHQSLPNSIVLDSLHFAPAALEGIRLSNIKFSGCLFAATGVAASSFESCQFINCRFDSLDLSDAKQESFRGTSCTRCDFGSITPVGKNVAVYDPELFPIVLSKAGFVIEPPIDFGRSQSVETSQDGEFETIARIKRLFATRTHVTEQLIRTKFGKHSNLVLTTTVPELLKRNILYKDTYRGGGKQEIFRLGVSSLLLDEALARAKGNSKEFYRIASQLVSTAESNK
jgi:hypothetical protein